MSISGLNLFSRDDEKYFDHFFRGFPCEVELYDAKGFLKKMNQSYSAFWDQPVENLTANFNILTDEKVVESGFISFVRHCFAGEYVNVSSDQYAYRFFNAAVSGEIFESTLIPLHHRKVTKGMLALHKKIVDEQAALSDNLAGENDRTTNRIADAFLSNVSHELRTPLNWIIGFSDLISAETNIEKIKEYNKTVLRGSNLLLSQIEMLIDASMIVQNDLQITLSELHLGDFIRKVGMVVNDELETLNKDIIINTNLNFDEENPVVHTDEHKLKQVFFNLLHNSLKFTEKGFIEIGGSRSETDEYTFYIKDTGTGIPRSWQRYIFDLFTKGDESYSSRYNGQGLGLTICKDYVRVLGGKIWLVSEYGNGSTFYFTIVNHQGRVSDHHEKSLAGVS